MQDNSAPIKHKDLAIHRMCPYNVVTFLPDCISCTERCIPLQNQIGENFELLIDKSLRDELFEYLYGNNGGKNPLIKIRELTGIPLVPTIKVDNILLSPSNLLYLNHLDENEYKKHWRIYYKGYYALMALGNLRQGGFLIDQIPEDIEQSIAYYKAHVAILQGKVKPEDILKNLNLNEIDDTNSNQITFDNTGEAAQIFVKKVEDLVNRIPLDKEIKENDKKGFLQSIRNVCSEIIQKIDKIS